MKEYRNYMYFVKVPDTGIEGCYFEPEYFDEATEAIKFATELVEDDPETRVVVTRVGFDGYDDLGNPDVDYQEDDIIWDSHEEEDYEDEAEEIDDYDFEEAERDARIKFDRDGWDETKPSQAYLEGCKDCKEGCTNEACEKKLDECGPVEEACEKTLEECGTTDVDESVNKAEATKLTTFDGKRPDRLDVNSPKSELNEDGEDFLDYYLDDPSEIDETAVIEIDPFDVDWTEVKPTEEE